MLPYCYIVTVMKRKIELCRNFFTKLYFIYFNKTSMSFILQSMDSQTISLSDHPKKTGTSYIIVNTFPSDLAAISPTTDLLPASPASELLQPSSHGVVVVCVIPGNWTALSDSAVSVLSDPSC